MQITLRWVIRCLAVASLAIALPASAYLQFTYTSQQLPLTAHLIEGWPQELFEPPLPAPAFTLSFQAAEQDLSVQPLTHFLAENFTFSLISPEADYIYYPVDISSTSYGQLSLNRQGEVAQWDLMLQMTELITPDTDMLFYDMHDHQISVTSSSETGDQLTIGYHPITWHRHWIQLAQLEFTFANAGSGHWTVETISVPEPRLIVLLSMGLLVLFWSRQKRKHLIDDDKNRVSCV